MDNALETMIANLKKNTGMSLDQWVTLVRKQNFEKHGVAMKFLKGEHGLTHGFANLIAHKSKGSDSDSVKDKGSLIDTQYKGKEHWRPLYDNLIKKNSSFGNDIEISPKKAYVSLRRKKQFAMLIPATKTRYEIGLNAKGHTGDNLAEEITKANSMCSHKIKLKSEKEVNAKVIAWIKKAYESAG
jgi:predicted transport protein